MRASCAKVNAQRSFLEIIMKVFFLGSYSSIGVAGLMDSSYAARKTAVSTLLSKVSGKLKSLHYLFGEFDVLAELEVPNLETASGLRIALEQSGAWSEVVILPEFDLDKAIKAHSLGTYKAPGQEGKKAKR